MHPPHYSHRATATKSHSALASCLVAFLFLLIVSAAALAVLFFLFKPKSPIITLTSLHFPSFTLSHSTLNFTLSQFLSLHNPNRIFPFSHYDSTLLLFVSGTQLGSLFIPAGNVPAGGTQLIGATFEVRGCEVGVGEGEGEGMVVEMEMRVKVNGKVRVLRVFAHRVGKEVRCWVSVGVADGTVLGVRC